MAAGLLVLLSSPPSITAYECYCGSSRVTNIDDIFGVFEALSGCKTVGRDNTVMIRLNWNEFNDLVRDDGYLDSNLRYAGYENGHGPQQVMSKLCAQASCGIQVRTTPEGTITGRSTEWVPAVTSRGLLDIVSRNQQWTAREAGRGGPVFRYTDEATISRHWNAATRGEGVFRNAVYEFSMDVTAMTDALAGIFDQ